jgi:hypothetical protein
MPTKLHFINRVLLNLLKQITTNYMEESPSWENNWYTSSQEIYGTRRSITKSPPRVPILSQINPFHALIPLTEDPF